MFFDSWQGLLRVLIVGTLAYVSLVLLLRASGKRTLSKLNAFDLVVTVALGSTLATVLLSKDVPLAEGVLGLFLLITLQFVVTWTKVRSRWFSRIVVAEPTLLFYRGQFLSGAMRRQRLTEEEIRSYVRQQGVGSMEDVEAVVLEPAADLSVIKRGGEGVPLLDDVGTGASQPHGVG